MIGNFSGVFVGYEKRTGKNGEYCILRFLDERGKMFECITRENLDSIICIDRFQEVDFVADVDIRDTYTKITYMGLV